MPSRLIPTKTRRGKRILDDRASKLIENDKMALIVRGGKTSSSVVGCLADLYMLKKPFVRQLKRHNPIHPFDDDTLLEKFSQKFDSSLFLFGSSSKKRPNSLLFGRMFDYHVLDMVEMRINSYRSSAEFIGPKFTLATKPCLVFQGERFQSEPTLKRVANLFVDWFRGPTVDKVRLQGLELVIAFTATSADRIQLRVYRTILKKSASRLPRVELCEIGPSIDLCIQRTKLASDDHFKAATKQPIQLKQRKRKNESEDVFGTKLARVHVGKQNLGTLQTRKVKALKVQKSPLTPKRARQIAPTVD